MKKVKVIEVILISESNGKVIDSFWKFIEEVFQKLDYKVESFRKIDSKPYMDYQYTINREISVEDIPIIVAEVEKKYEVDYLRFSPNEDDLDQQEKSPLVLRFNI